MSYSVGNKVTMQNPLSSQENSAMTVETEEPHGHVLWVCKLTEKNVGGQSLDYVELRFVCVRVLSSKFSKM